MATLTRGGATESVAVLEYRVNPDDSVALAWKRERGAEIGQALPGDVFQARGLPGSIIVGDDGVARWQA